jgi:hypothetical protein
MSDTDTKVRETLRDLAEEARIDPNLPPRLRRRVTGRRALNVALATGLAAAVVVGAVFGVAAAIRVRGHSTLRPAASQTPTATSEPWPGLYPATTLEDAQRLQDCADADEARCIAYLSLEDVVRGYAKEHLGWAEVFFNDSFEIGPDESGPTGLRIGRCEAMQDLEFPAGCTVADLTVERVLRHDPTGVWFVVGAHAYVYQPEGAAGQTISETQAKDFIGKFMALRFMGASQTLGFLSETAKAQYDQHLSDHLYLFDDPHGGDGGLVYTGWRIADVREGDANSFEIDVEIEANYLGGGGSQGSFGETFLVGPGQNYKGNLQGLVIRSVLGGAGP